MKKILMYVLTLFAAVNLFAASEQTSSDVLNKRLTQTLDKQVNTAELENKIQSMYAVLNTKNLTFRKKLAELEQITKYFDTEGQDMRRKAATSEQKRAILDLINKADSIYEHVKKIKYNAAKEANSLKQNNLNMAAGGIIPKELARDYSGAIKTSVIVYNKEMNAGGFKLFSQKRAPVEGHALSSRPYISLSDILKEQCKAEMLDKEMKKQKKQEI
ncbi:hypothetical protein Dip518_000492 [Parelusimicrobium proximum]|uniref:hypothetical protein n=1 Tax=Parelusimicrobium proximum TaxID=3228953 RepID=UPI003D177407